MNIILKTARIARGVKVKTLAAALGIAPAEYLELESRLRPVTPKLAKALSGYYSLPFYYFDELYPDPEKRMDTLGRRISSLAQEEEPPISWGPTANSGQALMESLLQQRALRSELKELLHEQVLLYEQMLSLMRLYREQ